MIRIAAVVLLALLVAVGFGGKASAAAPGTCRIRMASAIQTDRRFGQVLDAALPDGSVVVGSSYLQGNSAVVHLRRVVSGCRVVARFGVVLHGSGFSFWGIDAIAATPDGRILLAGNAGRKAVVGRLFASGGIDRSFGENGWSRFMPYKHRRYGNNLAFSASSITVAPNGTIVVGGTDGGAHCCVRSFVSELKPDGNPVESFGSRGSRVVPIIGSYAAGVFANADGSIYVFGQDEGSGCGDPEIVRVLPDGSVDRPFDVAMKRTVKRLTPREMRFTPTLVPDGVGGFTLVGGLDRTCRLPNPRQPSGGVSVRIDSSGRVVGELTHFVSPHLAFDSPAALRLPSGRVLAAASGVSSALVQVFGPDGWRDPSYGDHGLLRIAPPRGVHERFPSVDLLPAGDGGALLVIGRPHEIDLTPVPVQ